jgi:superfamily II DNA/RNA helicase
LKEVYRQIDTNQVIVFVNTRSYVNAIFDYLTKEGYEVVKMMGKLDPAERDDIMKKFRLGEINFLISTSLLSRGIDIPGMNLVINFDVPYIKDKDGFFVAQYSDYLHRIGRTGRFDTKGVACTLIGEDDFDNEMTVLNEIKENYQAEINEIKTMDELFTVYQDHVLKSDE